MSRLRVFYVQNVFMFFEGKMCSCYTYIRLLCSTFVYSYYVQKISRTRQNYICYGPKTK